MSDTPTSHHLTRQRVKLYDDGTIATFDHKVNGTLPSLYDITITPHTPEKAPGQVWQLPFNGSEWLILASVYEAEWDCVCVGSGGVYNAGDRRVWRHDESIYLRDEPLPPVHNPQPGDIFQFESGFRVVVTGHNTAGAPLVVPLSRPSLPPYPASILSRPHRWEKVER